MYMIKKIIICCTATIFLTACTTRRTPKKGQEQPLSSPSGAYTVEMPILESNKKIDYPVWTPTIKNEDGEIIYTDSSSNLSGYHNSYWDWKRNFEEERDELWVYNSDLGEVTRYYMNNGKWQKVKVQAKNEAPKIIQEKLHN